MLTNVDAWHFAEVTRGGYTSGYASGGYGSLVWTALPPETSSDRSVQAKRKAYDDHLQGRVVLDTVFEVAQFFQEERGA